MVRMQGGCCAHRGRAVGQVRCTHVARARRRSRIASISHYRAGWDGDGGRGGGEGGGVEAEGEGDGGNAMVSEGGDAQRVVNGGDEVGRAEAAVTMVAKAPCQAEAYGRRERWRRRGGRCG